MTLESALLREVVSDAAGFWEGSTSCVPVTGSGRDRGAREERMRLHGVNCAVCGMSFRERYGPDDGPKNSTETVSDCSPTYAFTMNRRSRLRQPVKQPILQKSVAKISPPPLSSG